MPLTFSRQPSQLRGRQTEGPKIEFRRAADFGLRGEAAFKKPIYHAANGTNALMVRGCAVPYGVLSNDLGGFRERYERGCFRQSLTNPELRVAFNHDYMYILGRVGNNTASFDEAPDGLWCSATPPDTQWAKDMMQSVARGDIDSMSAGFIIKKDRWENNRSLRVIEEGRLVEVSVITFAAYPQTVASVENADSDDDSVQMLAAGMPLTLATRAASPILSTEQRIANLRDLIQQLPRSKNRQVDTDYIKAMMTGLPDVDRMKLRLELAYL